MYHELVLLGVLLSILFYELTGYSPAGLVVGGYIALSLQTPMRIVYTLVIVVAAWGLSKLLSRWMILYGRRRFAVMILLSFLVDLALRQMPLPFAPPGLIGCLIPGIIAQDCEKQGVVTTFLSLGILTALMVIIMMFFGLPMLPVGLL